MTKARYPFFDSYRGFALIIMTIYHFSFDLNYFGVIQQNMNHSPFWLGFRAFIMTSFLGLVGVSFQFSGPRFSDWLYRRRLWILLSCALIISAVSFVINPQTWIYFGVLHFIFFTSLLSPILVRFPKVCLLVGVGIVLLPHFYQHLWFFKPGWILTGLSPIKPNTEDFSPIAPWLGVTMIGVFVGYLVKSYKPYWARKNEIVFLSWLGKRSLLFYMTHQLILFPLAWIISKIV